MKAKIAVLPGDGIGPEVMASALAVLSTVLIKAKHELTFEVGLIGGAAFDKHGTHFPAATEELGRQSAAILFGSVGGPLSEAHLPKWDKCEANSILALRKAFALANNLRPIRVWPALRGMSPLKPEVIGKGVDIMIVRELLGDVYFGERKSWIESGERKAMDTATYSESQIRGACELAFKLASSRRQKVSCVHKANVMETSRLWRAVAREVGQRFPGVELEEVLVDNCAMQLVRDPGRFDVLVTSNMFGDILSDLAAVLPGSLGLTPSASMNAKGFGLYEPSGGSAPDIAGQGIANPVAQILSGAMMLRLSFGLEDEARKIEAAIEAALRSGARTRDIAGPGEKAIGTMEFTEAVLKNL